MCLIFLSLNDHPTYKLVIAANRDEFYNRKTAPADYWKDHPEIIGGRDLEAQGTWMAMTLSGKISLITNYRDPHHINPKAPSRGRLVSNYLEGSVGPEDYLIDLARRGSDYNGFNLLVGNENELWYYSNYHAGIKKIVPGQYGLSNHLLDTPWPKVAHGKAVFRSILQKARITSAELFEFLSDEKRASDNELPDTGVGVERERALSSMFIKSPGYGTRCSTVVLVDHENKALFCERVFDLQTFEYSERTFEFTISS